MRKLIYLMALAIFAGACSSRATLRFHEDGTFKIVQFTDTHIIYDNPASDRVDSVIREVLEAERPDLVIFTGDQIFGKPAAKGLDKQFSIVQEFDIPFAYTFGNHDREQDMTGEELLAHAKSFPNFLIGEGDIPISSNKSDSTAAVIYIFDSGDYSTLKEDSIDGYGWITPEKIEQYAEKSSAYKAANGGKPLPSLAFYHIPIPEYMEAKEFKGTFAENVCCPKINTGLFARMLIQGDVIANFVGHDHDNNYVFLNKGIALCYGQFSGGNTVYNNIGCGARVIELQEGSRSFRTWIRMLGGEVKELLTTQQDK